jgi:hypothetical protein
MEGDVGRKGCTFVSRMISPFDMAILTIKLKRKI